MKKFQFSFAFSIIVLVLSGCKEQPPEPKNNDITPGKREYIWSVDTLFYHPGGQTLLTSLWGSSSTNVYTVGHDAHAGTATMWHFNGEKWSIVGLLPAYGGQIEGPYDLQSIYGFDSANIYACGNRIYQTFSSTPPYFLDSTFIIHFDGVSWKEIDIKREKGQLFRIYPMQNQNIWFSGHNYFLYSLIDNQFHIDSIPASMGGLSHLAVNIMGIYTDNLNSLYTLLTVFDDTNGDEWNYNYVKLNSGWMAIDSFSLQSVHRWGASFVWRNNDGTLYSCGDGIFQRTESVWIQIFKPGFIIKKLWGTSNENIFALSVGGPVYHYNGIDWSELSLPQVNEFRTAGIWGTSDEVFISAHDGNKTIMIHGK